MLNPEWLDLLSRPRRKHSWWPVLLVLLLILLAVGAAFIRGYRHGA